MYHESERLPRRRFNEGVIGITLAGYLAYLSFQLFAESSHEEVSSVTKLSQLASYERQVINPPHKNLIGSLINIPFAAYYSSPEMVSRIVENMLVMNSHIARLYVPNEFEKPTGTYHLEYLTKLSNFISDLHRHSDGQISCIVVIEDTYNLLHSNKPNSSYGSKQLDHHALHGATDPAEIKKYQQRYFTNRTSSNEYIQRAQTIMQALEPVKSSIAAWEVANEAEITFETDYAVVALTNWYSRVTPGIRDIDNETPIISGLKNPMLIDAASLVEYGLDHNSAHIYDSNGVEQQATAEYIQEMKTNLDLPPLLVPEIGFTRNFNALRMPKFFHDWQIAKIITDVILKNTDIDQGAKVARFPIANFGVWQLDTGNPSHDGFQFDPQRYPRMAETMNVISNILTPS